MLVAFPFELGVVVGAQSVDHGHGSAWRVPLLHGRAARDTSLLPAGVIVTLILTFSRRTDGKLISETITTN